jgi:hypothetical protein
MAISGVTSSYDMIQAHRARLRSFAALGEQRSLARREAAEMTLAKGDNLRNAVQSSFFQASTGMTQLMEMTLRARSAADAKAKAEPAKWYA